ncbi:uncharacterized protein LOC122260302 [Penaeus japonicus]|uniref:uncharacterized protein LOC122260302 n=1 Tax=Penaeus japonicus TaxID=27405 RepID=UPI001C712C49|nr:uncharacterized protein LOC122260302 [Penaeus japonicus]
MMKREVVGAVLCVAALFGGAWAAVPGPNDLRYPDYIVNPPVQCSVEGSFHHPRNCSWYYRCVDRMKIGYFHTFYFECEPGTVFSDDLDQCVFPHLIGPPCGTAGDGSGKPTPVPPPVPPPVPQPCIFRDQDCEVQKLCQPSEVKVFCTSCQRGFSTVSVAAFCGGSGLVYDRGLRRCVLKPHASRQCPKPVPTPPTPTTPPTTPSTPTPTPETPKPDPNPGTVSSSGTVNCLFDDTVCEKRELCQPSETRTLCRQCRIGSVLIDPCDKDEIYDLDIRDCVAEPGESRQCQPDTPTGNLNCIFNDNVCQKQELCNPSETRTLCKQCYVGDTPITYCAQGLIYDLELKICVPEPGDSRACEVTVPGQNSVQCSDLDTRPDHDWIRRLFCTRYNLCSPNNVYTSSVNLCTNYYQCYKNTNGSWSVEKRNCVGDKLYSFETDSCESKPAADELCRN